MYAHSILVHFNPTRARLFTFAYVITKYNEWSAFRSEMSCCDTCLIRQLVTIMQCEAQNEGMPRKRPVKWTAQEDELLTYLAYYAQQPPQWKIIASKLAQKLRIPQRASSDVRQRWMRVIQPRFRKGKWSQQEDDMLLSLVYTHHHNWAQLSNAMKTRSDIQIKYRVEKLGL